LPKAGFIPFFLFLNFFAWRKQIFQPFPLNSGRSSTGKQSPNQLFIIGLAHRDSLTGLSVPKVSRVQAEVYKLGQWLIQNEHCELLCPRVFFATPATKTGKVQKRVADEKLSCPESIDLKALEEKLYNRSFVNAELLLKELSLEAEAGGGRHFHRPPASWIRKLVNWWK
jgi:hypothetical protein